MRQLGEDIASHVHKICCYGATNIGQSKEAKDEYFKFLKAITVMFITHKELSLQKMGLSEREQQAYNKLAQEIKAGKFKFQNAIFKPGETIAMVTIDQVLHEVDLLRFVNKLYPLSQKI
jgi:TATA-box binding protein (TBP) (component of TFIID and TFIIIB)